MTRESLRRENRRGLHYSREPCSELLRVDDELFKHRIGSYLRLMRHSDSEPLKPRTLGSALTIPSYRLDRHAKDPVNAQTKSGDAYDEMFVQEE
jgi:hypothetical protein